MLNDQHFLEVVDLDEAFEGILGRDERTHLLGCGLVLEVGKVIWVSGRVGEGVGGGGVCVGSRGRGDWQVGRHPSLRERVGEG